VVDVSRWDRLVIEQPIAGGHRNQVFRGSCAGRPVSIRQSRRSPESLRWEVELIDYLAASHLWVPEVVPTIDGAPSAGDWIVQEWLDGEEPTSDTHWRAVARTLETVHELTADYPQRPDCCTVGELGARRRSADADLDLIPGDVEAVLLATFESLPDVPVAVVHGDPHAPNIRIGADGRVGLLDFDESRVDLVWHDFSNLGVQVLADADHARAQRLSHAWEAANGWVVEPEYARSRLAQLLAP